MPVTPQSSYRPNGISVVIPNYNGKYLLEANLPALYEALRLASVPYEIIVPDDASTDDSLVFLRKEFPEVIRVKNVKNQGFSPNINTGIKIAQYELVFLMNSDVKLVGDYFTPQFYLFQAPDTFGVMGRIIGYDNDVIQDAAKRQETNVLKISANDNVIPSDINQKFFPSFFLSGANSLIDRKKLLLLNGFDEIYAPFYGEDLDLSLRAWRVGWKCYYQHNSICRHPDSVTIKKYNKRKKIKIISYRNRLLFHAIHLSGFEAASWSVWIRLQMTCKAVLLKTTFATAFFQFLKFKSRIIESRKAIAALGSLTGVLNSHREVYRQVASEQMNKGFIKIS